MLSYNKLILLVFLIFFTSFAFSEEEDSSLNLIYQKITQLEEELSALRSLVEENTYLIEKSQELHKQRYMDLDKRLHEVMTSPLEGENINDTNEGAIDSGQVESSQEIILYRNALELFENKRYAESLETFREQIISYPEGKFAGDAYFWSGEVYFFQQMYLDAAESYLVVIDKYTGHQRTADSLYKLGIINQILSQEDQAKVYFDNLIKNYPNSGASLLAKKSLGMIEEQSKKEDDGD